jgi:hypothetical protein
MNTEGKLLMKGQTVGESYLQTEQICFAESQFDKIFRKALHQPPECPPSRGT